MGGVVAVVMGVALSVATGVLLMLSVRGRRRPEAWDIVAGACLGVTVSSLSYGVYALFVWWLPSGWLVADLAVLAAAIAWHRRVCRGLGEAVGRAAWPHWSAWIAAGVLSIVTVLCLVAIAGATAGNPYGQWDAWAMWNFKAGLFYHLPQTLDGALTADDPHPDYPLLLPMTVARLWRYLGEPSHRLPQFVAAGFTVANVLLVATGIAALRGAIAGCLAGLTVLGSVVFVIQGSWQYADVPLALFISGALLMLARWIERDDPTALLLAGLFAGAAAWTKNEGVPLLGLVALAAVFRGRGRDRWRALGWMVIAASPFVLAHLTVKVLAEQGTDLFVAADAGTWVQRLRDSWRFEQVGYAAAAVVRAVFPLPSLAVLVACAALGLGVLPRRAYAAAGWVLAVVLVQGLVFIVVYLAFSNDLEWHLRTSASRLAVQLWPGAAAGLALLLPPDAWVFGWGKGDGGTLGTAGAPEGAAVDPSGGDP